MLYGSKDVKGVFPDAEAMAWTGGAVAVGLVAMALCVQLPEASGERKLLSDISGLVDQHLREDSSEQSVNSLGRMLLAFNGLGILNKEPTTGLGLGLSDKFGLKPDKLGLKNIGGEVGDQKRELIGSKIDTLQDVSELGQMLLNGDASPEQLAAGHANALARYFTKLMEREQQILEAVSAGDPDEDFSYLVDFPQTGVRQKLLPLFGVVDVEELTNLTAAVQEKFCSPMAMLPRRTTGRRTVINGPSFELTLAGGRCELLPHDNDVPLPFVFNRLLNCSGHEVSYTRTPLAVHRRDVIPEAFASEECQIERAYGTPYDKVLYGGGPLVRFDSVNDFIDAVVTQKYNMFGGFQDILTLAGGAGAGLGGVRNKGVGPGLGGFGKGVLDKKTKFDFWSPVGPGRLLKDKAPLGKRIKKIGLADLLDFDATSPLTNLGGFNFKGKKLFG